MSSQQRKEEILAKKAKLAELRRTRELRGIERGQREASGSSAEVTQASTPNRRESRQDIDALISQLVDRPQSGRVSREGSPMSKGSRPSSFYGGTSVAGGGQVLSDATSPGRRTPNRGSLLFPNSNYVSSAIQTLPDETSQGAEVAPPRVEVTPAAAAAPAPKSEWSSVNAGIQVDPTDPLLGAPPEGRRDPYEELAEPDSPSTTRHQRERKEEEIRDKLRQEIIEELREIKDPSADQEANGVQRFPARELTDEELNAVTISEDFSDFIERSSKVIERALEEEYDLLADYALDGGAKPDDEEDGYGGSRARGKGRRIKEVARFYDEKWSKRRMISDINFSPKFPELVLAAYARSSGNVVDYAGCVQVWNMHMQTRPEYVFHATSDVLTAKFSPFHPSYVVGGSYSGQVLLWDTRSKSSLPVSKTPLSGASAGGHTHPVYSVDVVGTQNANNIISCSTDGVCCGWTVDMLQQPQEFLELLTPPPSRTDELSPTCMAFPPADPTSFFVGTEEGSMYSCHRYDRAGAKAGVDSRIRYRGHTAPVMSLDFHSNRGPVDLSDLVLTTSLDWSVKLWKARTTGASSAASGAGATAGSGTVAGGRTASMPTATAAATSSSSAANASSAAYTEIHPVMSFSREDVVYDARWSPARPAVFATVDGAGSVEVWDLLVDTEIPVARAAPSADRRVESIVRPTPVSLNKVAWDGKDGKRLAVGGASGLVTAFEVGPDLCGGPDGTVRQDEWAGLKRAVGRAEREAAVKR